MSALLNLLITFPYCTPAAIEWLRAHRGEYRLIIDSGAFSAHNSGKPVALDDYCRFLDEVADLEPLAVQLDVIGDPEATWTNYQTMRSRGYSVLPVFTRGSPAEMLERMYSTTDYVLLGGMVGRRDNLGFLKWASKLVAGRKVHWLGQVDVDAIKLFRPTSVDSTSWLALVYARLGGQAVFYRGAGRFDVFSRAAFKASGSVLFSRAVAHGLTEEEAKELRSAKHWTSQRTEKFVSSLVRLCVHAAVLRAVDVERFVGTKIYFACSSCFDFQLLLGARDRLKEKRLV